MKTFINELASTNWRIFLTTNLFAVTVVTLLAAMMLGLNLDRYEWIIGMIFTAEGVFAGLDVTQFTSKRKTDAAYMAALQPNVNVEQAQTVKADGDVNVGAAPRVTAVRASRVLIPDD
jgi:hypothetical protein